MAKEFFFFMKNLIEQLRYVGGNDEGLGGYCEALIITINNEEKYVLHKYGEYVKTIESDEKYPTTGRPVSEKNIVCGRHEKIEFTSKKDLLIAFPFGHEKLWQETSRSCGYNIPKEEFMKAHERRFDEEYSKLKTYEKNI